MNDLTLSVPATRLDFDPVAGEEASLSNGCTGRIPEDIASGRRAARFGCYFDPKSASVVIRVGEASPRCALVPMVRLVEAFLAAERSTPPPEASGATS